jgi:hypothetical protein
MSILLILHLISKHFVGQANMKMFRKTFWIKTHLCFKIFLCSFYLFAHNIIYINLCATLACTYSMLACTTLFIAHVICAIYSVLTTYNFFFLIIHLSIAFIQHELWKSHNRYVHAFAFLYRSIALLNITCYPLAQLPCINLWVYHYKVSLTYVFPILTLRC